MLYIFHGSDTHKVADRTNALVAALRKKQPDAGVYVFEGVIEEVGVIDELVEARGLFVAKHIVVLKGVCEKKESREHILKRLPQFAAAEHAFVLSEGSVHAAHKKVFAEHAFKIEEYSKPKQDRGFDPFGVTASLKARKRRDLWEAYLQARYSGESPEALAGLMHWAVKDMLGKPRIYAQHYTSERLRALSREIIKRYHEAHRGLYELDTALERWTLSI